jgi:hypothetical protein
MIEQAADMSLTYLDTSALMRWSEGRSANTTERNKKIAPVLQSMLADPGRSFACSELTILEFHSNLSDRLRDQNEAHYDDEWWTSARNDVLDRIADRHILVLPTPPRAFEHVMALITTATSVLGRKLRAWDALHAVVAAEWANATGSVVEVVTSDADFNVVMEITGLGTVLRVLNLDVLASTGEAADRANRA